MAYGIEAIRKWQTVEDLISIKNEDGTYDEVPIQRIPNSLFPKFFALGMKFESDIGGLTEKDIRDFIDMIVQSIKNSNQEGSEEEIRNFVLTKFREVTEAFMGVNGGDVELSEVPEDVKRILDSQEKKE